MPRDAQTPGQKSRALQGEPESQTSTSQSGQQVEEYSNNVFILPRSKELGLNLL